jgi:hypothetical protein
MVQWESVGELNAMRLLDADPSVRSFAEQPLMIRYRLDGEDRVHYPDLLVEWDDGHKALWEVKPEREAAQDEIAARTNLLRTALPNYGYQYSIVHSEELCRQPRLSNVLEILKWGRAPVSAVDRERIHAILTELPSVTWRATISGVLGCSGRNALCRLVLEGVVDFDVNEKLGPETRFSLTRERPAA